MLGLLLLTTLFICRIPICFFRWQWPVASPVTCLSCLISKCKMSEATLLKELLSTALLRELPYPQMKPSPSPTMFLLSPRHDWVACMLIRFHRTAEALWRLRLHWPRTKCNWITLSMCENGTWQTGCAILLVQATKIMVWQEAPGLWQHDQTFF